MTPNTWMPALEAMARGVTDGIDTEGVAQDVLRHLEHIPALIEAAKPFAELIEDPENYPDVADLWRVETKDVVALRSALSAVKGES